LPFLQIAVRNGRCCFAIFRRFHLFSGSHLGNVRPPCAAMM
jgi:hypothetical protein